ncbi:Protein of unknown function, DUF538 [Quillaja saponaria]|uniref:Uncharacterized protein n=1 Tax=Quillaja saponaria TaxID=32244 RepID=A0AAD7LCA2_QUISA|nr:Protein of unknown function, DUF538 [Quillaja saponaria]
MQIAKSPIADWGGECPATNLRMASSLMPVTSISLFLAFISLTHVSLSLKNPQFNFNHPLNSVTDIHDLLAQYGLPKGLLPNNVKSYSLSDDGDFQIELERPCYVHFDLLVYYDKKIKGKLSYGIVSHVTGIQAQKLFLWLSVTGMKADDNSGMVEFYVGSLSKKLPAKQFEDIPGCKRKGCQKPHPETI